MSSPGAGFLEGLAGGFTGGYGFRQGIAERKRRAQLQADLLLLRQQESARQQAEEERAATTFGEQQSEYQRMLRTRAGVAEHFHHPERFATLGQFVSGKPPTRGPVSGELQVPQAVGRALGNISGVPLSEDEQLLAGTDPEVAKAILESGQQRMRLRALRGTSARLPITLNAALEQLDQLYTRQDQKTGEWRSLLSPAKRMAFAQRMVAGTLNPAELPDFPEEAPPPAAAPSQPWQAPEWLRKIGRALIGGRGPEPAAAQPGPQPGMVPTVPQPAPITAPRSPGQQPGNVAQPSPLTAPGQSGFRPQPAPISGPQVRDRITHGRTMIRQPRYQELPPEDLEGALREAGYSDEEIAAILGRPSQ